MKFKVLLQEAVEGGYIVSCLALPGCHSQGDTAEDALENIKEAITGCLDSLADSQKINDLDINNGLRIPINFP